METGTESWPLLCTVALASPLVGHTRAGAGAEAGGTAVGTVATADGVAQPFAFFFAVLRPPLYVQHPQLGVLHYSLCENYPLPCQVLHHG